MRKLAIVLVVAVLLAACGDGSDSADTTENGDSGTNSPGAPDPCTLAGDSVLVAYFGDAAVEGEPGEAGPIATCSWRDANSNSLLIQTCLLYTSDAADEYQRV